jgi:hypothetical protein
MLEEMVAAAQPEAFLDGEQLIFQARVGRCAHAL